MAALPLFESEYPVLNIRQFVAKQPSATKTDAYISLHKRPGSCNVMWQNESVCCTGPVHTTAL
ncbi:hypothetical protein IE4803_PB00172 (plasmid) [Rhizobium etli bv. phaseoli str. IE4803]|nr:hypothetical protein IE4803_PB00172 [Rhizobium etli bv. phaseoli str. IE4803]